MLNANKAQKNREWGPKRLSTENRQHNTNKHQITRLIEK